jgi:hypothetical protein
VQVGGGGGGGGADDDGNGLHVPLFNIGVLSTGWPSVAFMSPLADTLEPQPGYSQTSRETDTGVADSRPAARENARRTSPLPLTNTVPCQYDGMPQTPPEMASGISSAIWRSDAQPLQ